MPALESRDVLDLIDQIEEPTYSVSSRQIMLDLLETGHKEYPRESIFIYKHLQMSWSFNSPTFVHNIIASVPLRGVQHETLHYCHSMSKLQTGISQHKDQKARLRARDKKRDLEIGDFHDGLFLLQIFHQFEGRPNLNCPSPQAYHGRLTTTFFNHKRNLLQWSSSSWTST